MNTISVIILKNPNSEEKANKFWQHSDAAEGPTGRGAAIGGTDWR